MLKAGAGRSDITPPVGIAHAGWGAATHQRAEGVDMPFYATALYVTDGDLELAIVDLDIGILTNEDDAAIRAEVEAVHRGIVMDGQVNHLNRIRASAPAGRSRNRRCKQVATVRSSTAT